MPATPVIDLGRGFRWWNKNEIYEGPLGPPENRFVPNVDDAVWDWNLGLYRVIDVDSITHLSTLDPYSFTDLNGGVLAEDILLSTGPNRISESFRIYINTSVTPHTLAFDHYLYFNGSSGHHVKVFKGVDIGPTGHVISGIFNVSNVLISEDIPVENIIIPGTTNLAAKAPIVANSIEALQDGEVVTCVLYSVTGVVLSVSRLVVNVTDFVHTNDLGKKYVIGIELLSPYLSVTDSELLEYPVNMLVQSASLQGKVTYSDASTETLPIDGTRFQLLGVDRYVSTQAGNNADLVLVYNLLPTEYGYGVSAPLPERSLSRPYRVTSIVADGAYTVKLFVVPKWDTLTSKWVLTYYLYDLDRDTKLDATPYVTTVSNSPVFNGSLLNAWQRLTVVVNLADVNPAYLAYRYIQTFDIQLKAGGTNTVAEDYYLLDYVPGVTIGSGLKATTSPGLIDPLLKRLDISQNLTNTNDWLERVYYPLRTLIIPNVETQQLVPTHVIVKVGNSWMREITIAEAVVKLDSVTASLIPGTLVRLEFIRRTTVDLELGVLGINVRS